MSFLAGRLAGKEGSYFLQESKQAVTKLREKQRNSAATNLITPIADSSSPADVLPEVLRHNLPSKIFSSDSANSGSSLSTASKWALKPDPKSGGVSVSADALNPLRGYVSLPQVTFGPKRWQIPNSEGAVVASTANDLRQDKYAPINPEKLKAAAAGLTQIGSAFAVATAIVFGGAALIFGLAASRLQVHNMNDIRDRGKDLIQPRFETLKERLAPLRNWAEEVSKKWHLEEEGNLKESPLFKELSRTLGAKS
ncbi:uncharacterized protein LOC125211014 [Salvia hispanica]|uniref:uncharacterized protein LOC125211014 n=1 Tax=Salvia hispanica TaxID=49212 RepID=UPI002009A791|nr:uncharacterized protein LOC125211014 [Salvia hispanica]